MAFRGTMGRSSPLLSRALVTRGPVLDLYRNYAAILYYRTSRGENIKGRDDGLIYPEIIPGSYYSRPCVIPASEPAAAG